MKDSSKRSKKTAKTACRNRKKKPDAVVWAEKFEAFATRPEFVKWFFNFDQINQNFLYRLWADNFIAEAIVRKLFPEYPLRLKPSAGQKDEVCFNCLKDISDYLTPVKPPVKTSEGETLEPMAVPMFTGIDEEKITKLCDKIILDNQSPVECSEYQSIVLSFKQLAQSKKNAFLSLLKCTLIVRIRCKDYLVRYGLKGFSEIVIDQLLREFYLALGTAWTMLNDVERHQIEQKLEEAEKQLKKSKPLTGNRDGGNKTPTDDDFNVLADIIAEAIKSGMNWAGNSGKQGFRNHCIECWLRVHYWYNWPPTDQDKKDEKTLAEYWEKILGKFADSTRIDYFKDGLIVLLNRNDPEISEAVKSIAQGYPSIKKQLRQGN